VARARADRFWFPPQPGTGGTQVSLYGGAGGKGVTIITQEQPFPLLDGGKRDGHLVDRWKWPEWRNNYYRPITLTPVQIKR
jgi:hypothetical protein